MSGLLCVTSEAIGSEGCSIPNVPKSEFSSRPIIEAGVIYRRFGEDNYLIDGCRFTAWRLQTADSVFTHWCSHKCLH
jgi:hypothetical protein